MIWRWSASMGTLRPTGTPISGDASARRSLEIDSRIQAALKHVEGLGQNKSLTVGM